ncbi:hypothetical protein F511_46377 [Dorcoceras hygrometricum]|uniref:Uncharacterized protein n=1 Tax=Dorcoceras hygrometricum TaxID=472368 RepID=A0A2Z7A0L8_9LAMI|nr:hypothetical protein F511_46377 [Dorcoceras hygrometricum]
MAVPHRAHERARYMRAGRAWMGDRWTPPRASCRASLPARLAHWLRDDGGRRAAVRHGCRWLHDDAHWPRDGRATFARGRTSRQAASARFFVVAAPPTAAAPVMLRRCRDG